MQVVLPLDSNTWFGPSFSEYPKSPGLASPPGLGGKNARGVLLAARGEVTVGYPLHRLLHSAPLVRLNHHPCCGVLPPLQPSVDREMIAPSQAEACPLYGTCPSSVCCGLKLYCHAGYPSCTRTGCAAGAIMGRRVPLPRSGIDWPQMKGVGLMLSLLDARGNPSDPTKFGAGPFRIHVHSMELVRF